MITIKSGIETSLIVKKSRFIGLACRAKTEQEALAFLEQRRKQYYDASHHCFAYILENGKERCSDDGEPQGTAGRPILEVIKKSGVTDVIVISTRYFGGTLLGAGGLTRAYAKSASDALEAAEKVELVSYSRYRCVFQYEVWAKAETVLKKAGCVFEDTVYSDNVSAVVCVKNGQEKSFFELVRNLSLGQTVPEFIDTRMIEQKL